MGDGEFSEEDVDAMVNEADVGENGAEAVEETVSKPAETTPDANAELPHNELDNMLSNVAGAVETPRAAAPGSTAPKPAQAAPPGEVARPVRFPSLTDESAGVKPQNMEFLMDVALQVSVELGRSKMQVKDVLRLGMGSVIELNKLSGEPVDVMINGKLIAHGEVVVVDENFGVKIVDVLSPEQRMKNLS